MKKIIYLIVATSLISAGCGGGVQYKDPTKDKGSVEWGPKEIKDTVGIMVASLYSHLKAEKKAAFLQVKKIRNRTSEHIDTKMLSNELVNNLMKKRIRFIDASFTKEALEEIEKGMTGMIDPDSAIPAGELKSPNLFLYGDISDNTRSVGGKTLQYLVVTIKLKQLRTGIQVWQEQKEFLKVSKNTKVGW